MKSRWVGLARWGTRGGLHLRACGRRAARLRGLGLARARARLRESPGGSRRLDHVARGSTDRRGRAMVGTRAGSSPGARAGPAVVSLKAPPPLDRPLEVERSTTVSSCATASSRGRGPAREVDSIRPAGCVRRGCAAEGGPFWTPRTSVPECFVCGPLRDAGDGLRIFVGPVDGRATVRAPPSAAWTPPTIARRRRRRDARGARLGGARLPHERSGRQRPDAPGFLPIVLARLAVRIDAPVICGEPHVVMAWKLGVDGRKRESAAALYARAAATVCAVARGAVDRADGARRPAVVRRARRCARRGRQDRPRSRCARPRPGRPARS